MLYVSEWFLILAAYGSGIVLLLAFLRLVRGQRKQAVNFALLLVTFWLSYLLLGAAVAMFTPRRVLREGQARFFDETGVTATSLGRTSLLATGEGTLRAHGVFYVIRERIFNRSAKVPHHAPPLELLLQDPAGNLYGPDAAATRLLSRGFDPLRKSLFGPGESKTAEVAFDVPPNTERPSLIFEHRNRYTLNRILLGDPEHFWHRNTVILLDR